MVLAQKFDQQSTALAQKIDQQGQAIVKKIDHLHDNLSKTINKQIPPTAAQRVGGSGSDKENSPPPTAPKRCSFESPLAGAKQQAKQQSQTPCILQTKLNESVFEFENHEYIDDFHCMDDLHNNLNQVRIAEEDKKKEIWAKDYDQANLKKDEGFCAALDKEEETLEANIFKFPDNIRELFRIRNQVLKMKREGYVEQLPAAVETNDVAPWIAASLGQAADGGVECLGNRVIMCGNCCLLFGLNPLDDSFDEFACNDDMLSSFFSNVWDYNLSFSLAATVRDEDGDLVDVKLSVASNEFYHACEAYSQAVCVVLGIRGVASVTLESSVSKGTMVLPLLDNATRVLVSTVTDTPVCFSKSTITQSQQIQLARSNRPLKFEECQFETNGHGYPLLQGTATKSLKLIFIGTFLPFHHLEAAAKSGRLGSLHLILLKYRNAGKGELRDQLHSTEVHRLRSLFETAKEQGFDVTMEDFDHPTMGSKHLREYLQGSERWDTWVAPSVRAYTVLFACMYCV